MFLDELRELNEKMEEGPGYEEIPLRHRRQRLRGARGARGAREYMEETETSEEISDDEEDYPRPHMRLPGLFYQGVLGAARGVAIVADATRRGLVGAADLTRQGVASAADLTREGLVGTAGLARQGMASSVVGDLASAMGDLASASALALGNLTSSGVSTLVDAAATGVSSLLVDPLRSASNLIRSSFTPSVSSSDVFPESQSISASDVFPSSLPGVPTEGLVTSNPTNIWPSGHPLDFLSGSPYPMSLSSSLPFLSSEIPSYEVVPSDQAAQYSGSPQQPQWSQQLQIPPYGKPLAASYYAQPREVIEEPFPGFTSPTPAFSSSLPLFAPTFAPRPVEEPTSSLASRMSSSLPFFSSEIPSNQVVLSDQAAQYSASPQQPQSSQQLQIPPYDKPLAASYYAQPREVIEEPFPGFTSPTPASSSSLILADPQLPSEIRGVNLSSHISKQRV